MKYQLYIKESELKKFEAATNQLIKELSKHKADILLKNAKIVRDHLKEKAPKGPTGNLKSATYATVLPETSTRMPVAFAGIRPRKAPHAHLVEFGHAGPHPAPPHPFFRPVVDEVMPYINASIEHDLKEIIEK